MAYDFGIEPGGTNSGSGGGSSGASSYETFTGGEAIAVDECFYVAANGKAYQPDGTEATLKLTAYIAKTACTGDGASFEGWTGGLITSSGRTAGKRYFTTTGPLVVEDDLAATVPDGDWYRMMCHSRSDTQLFIDRQPPYPQDTP